MPLPDSAKSPHTSGSPLIGIFSRSLLYTLISTASNWLNIVLYSVPMPYVLKSLNVLPVFTEDLNIRIH